MAGARCRVLSAAGSTGRARSCRVIQSRSRACPGRLGEDHCPGPETR
jgi:hypothetical protein